MIVILLIIIASCLLFGGEETWGCIQYLLIGFLGLLIIASLFS